MHTQIFVNLPVKDLERSVAFFTAMGYAFEPRFTNENASCMLVADHIFVMLLVVPFFQSFTPKPVCDAHLATEALVCLSCESREEVDALVTKALAAGGSTPRAAQDLGFMYSHGYQDLDGHLWELVYMAPRAPLAD